MTQRAKDLMTAIFGVISLLFIIGAIIFIIGLFGYNIGETAGYQRGYNSAERHLTTIHEACGHPPIDMDDCNIWRIE